MFRSATNNVFIFLRSFYEDPKILRPAVDLVEQTKIYPLNGESGAKPMKFPDASGVPVNMLPISDTSVIDQLKRLVDSEGSNLADPDWLGMLAAIGIVKGQPFTPDAHTREILDRAAKTGYKMSRVFGFEEVVSGRSYRVYPDRRWTNPIADGTPANPGGPFDLAWRWTADGYLDLDARIWFFTDYYSLSPGMLWQTPGKGAKDMVAFTDSEGTPLSGGSNYRISLPPNIPAANFWSVMLYEAENSSGLAKASPSRRLARATSRCRTPTAARTSPSAPNRPRASRATGWRRRPARGTLSALDSIPRPKPPSTRTGSQETSSR